MELHLISDLHYWPFKLIQTPKCTMSNRRRPSQLRISDPNIISLPRVSMNYYQIPIFIAFVTFFCLMFQRIIGVSLWMHFVYDQMGLSDSTNKLQVNASFLTKCWIIIATSLYEVTYPDLGGMTYTYMIYQRMCFFDCIVIIGLRSQTLQVGDLSAQL